MDFQRIMISESGSMAYSTVYLAEKTDTGVHLEYYLGQPGWDDEDNDKIMIRQKDGTEELYNEIAALAGSYGLRSWDGFSGSDPDVLDGYGFSMYATLADGTEIHASGSNKFPDGYYGFVMALREICSREEITSTHFENGDYELELPESWIGNVYAVFSEGYVAFEVQTEVKNRTILCIYDEPYEYGDGKEEYQTITSYEKDGRTWYVVMRRYAESYSAYDEMNDTQKAICDSLDADMQAIADSLVIRDF